MKDSGVEWIGEIPRNWDISRIAHSVLFINGYAFKGDDLEETDTEDYVVRIGNIKTNGIDTSTCLRYKGISDEIAQYAIKPNDIVIAMSGATTGKNCYIKRNDEKLYINQRVGIIRSKNDLRFIAYNLNCNQFLWYIEILSAGSAQPNISGRDILNYIIPFPPLENQHRIADYLDRKCYKIDEIIENETKVIEKLKAYKQSVITEAVTKGVNPDVPMKDSGIEWIGEVPEHWVVSKIARVANANKYSMVDGPFGSDMKNEEYVDEGIPIVQLTNIKSFNHFTNTLKYITEEKHIQLSRHTAYKGDIVIAKMMPAGRACILSDEFDEYVLAADAIRLAVSDDINKNFVLYSLNTYCIEECTISSKGTTRVRISLDIARRLKIILPPFSEQQTIADYLDKKCTQIDETIAKKQATIEKLTAYKKSLIYEVVTGKKEV